MKTQEDREGAILAYLHTHLMFSSQPDAHAESLVRLVELWPKSANPNVRLKRTRIAAAISRIRKIEFVRSRSRDRFGCQ